MTIDFSSLESFQASQEALLQEARRLELAHACGGLLMLERAFEAVPIASRVEWELEFGDYRMELFVRAPDGREATPGSVINSLELAAVPPAPPPPPDDTGIVAAMRRLNLGSFGVDRADLEVAASFSFLTPEAANDLDALFREATRHLERFAPQLSCQTHAERQGAIELLSSDAPGLARQLGWHQAAAMIEASRVDRSLHPSAKPRDTPRSL
jgi:hypothetical protein